MCTVVLPVLEAVLAEPDVAAADLVVVTGDHAASPMPVETLDALAGLGERRLLVWGNADRELVAVAKVAVWSATMGRLVGRESPLERDRLWLADFDPTASGIPEPAG